MDEDQEHHLQDFIGAAKEGAASRRALAVRLVDVGVDPRLTGYSVKHAQRLRRQFFKHGVGVFEDKRISHRDRILTGEQRQQVIETLKTKQPAQVIAGCDAQYWTTGLLGAYIFHEFGKRYKSKTSQYLLFKEAKLSFHLPGRAYEKADPDLASVWMQQTKPILATHWRDEDTVILCEDEMVLTSKTTTQKVWLPQGKYPPVIDTNSSRKRANFYGFLNLKTGHEHAFVSDKQNMMITAGMLDEIRKIYPTHKLVIVWDNCGWHKGSKVTEWITHDANTEVIYFPPYTPELNPQEHVWKAARKATTHNQHIGAKFDQTIKEFTDHLTEQKFDYKLLEFHATMTQD